MKDEPFFIINNFLEQDKKEIEGILETLRGPKFSHYERSIFLRNFTNEMFNAYRKQKAITRKSVEEGKMFEKLRLQKQKELVLARIREVEEAAKKKEEIPKKKLILSRVSGKTLATSRFSGTNYELIEPILDKKDIELIHSLKNKVAGLLDNETALRKVIEDQTNNQISDEYFDKIRYYLIRDLSKYGKISPLLEDKNIKEVICNGAGRNILITYQDKTDVQANITLESDEEINGLVKHLAEINKIQVAPENPFLNFKIGEHFEINATLGSDLLKPKFVISRI